MHVGEISGGSPRSCYDPNEGWKPYVAVTRHQQLAMQGRMQSCLLHASRIGAALADQQYLYCRRHAAPEAVDPPDHPGPVRKQVPRVSGRLERRILIMPHTSNQLFPHSKEQVKVYNNQV